MGLFIKTEYVIPIASVIVHNKNDDTVLLGKRTNIEEFGLYGMPGGKQEVRERIEDTVCRELLEETGLVAKKLTRLGYIDEFIYQHFACHIFLCQVFEGEVTNKEPSKCQGWEWIMRTNISKMENKSELLYLVHQGDMLYGW